MELMKNVELDKICRICLQDKKDMRPLFAEMISEMLMECVSVKLENIDGWPDRICLQCVHQVSRIHAFKKRVEQSDRQLKQYIKGLTVIVEEPVKDTRIEIQRMDQQPQIQEIQLQRLDHNTANTHHLHQNHHPGQMIVTNVLNNNQMLNTGQILSPQIIQTANGQLVVNGLIQGPNNTVQMITQNGQTQVLQLRTSDDSRCEIILNQPTDMGEQYYEEQPTYMVQQQQQQHQQIEAEEEDEMQQMEEIEDEEYQCIEQLEEEQCEEGDLDESVEEHYVVETLDVQDTVAPEEDSDNDESKKFAEFLKFQTESEGPFKHICKLCRKEFRHVKWLHSHMKSHTNWIKANIKVLPKCDICEKRFRGPGMLRMHMQIHERDKKLPICTICNKEFKSKSILYRHRQTHFDRKPSNCKICNKQFVSNYQVNAHMAQHRAEKVHKCEHCKKSFYNSVDLTKHVDLQHLANKKVVKQKRFVNAANPS